MNEPTYFTCGSLNFTSFHFNAWNEWMNSIEAASNSGSLRLHFSFNFTLHSLSLQRMSVKWREWMTRCGRSINPAQFNHCVNVIEWRIEFTSLTRIAFSYHSITFHSTSVNPSHSVLPFRCLNFHYIQFSQRSYRTSFG